MKHLLLLIEYTTLFERAHNRAREREGEKDSTTGDKYSSIDNTTNEGFFICSISTGSSLQSFFSSFSLAGINKIRTRKRTKAKTEIIQRTVE